MNAAEMIADTLRQAALLAGETVEFEPPTEMRAHPLERERPQAHQSIGGGHEPVTER